MVLTYIKTTLSEQLIYSPGGLNVESIHIEWAEFEGGGGSNRRYDWEWPWLEILSQFSSDFLLVLFWIIGEFINQFGCSRFVFSCLGILSISKVFSVHDYD